MRAGVKNWLRSGTAAVVVIAASGPAWTQSTGGENVSLSLSQGIVSSSDDGTFGQTSLGFNFSNVTRTQDLQFSVNTGLEEQLNGGFDVDVVDPTFNLSYGIQNRQTALDFSARYRRSDVDSLTESTDPLSNVLVLDTGTRESANLSLEYTFGRDARFGGTFSTNYGTTTYSETTDPDLVDQNRVGADLGLRFEITPKVAATLGYTFNDTDRSGNGLDVRNTRVRAGADLTVSQTLSAGLSLGLTTVETTDNLGFTQANDGVVFAFNLRQDRPNGALSFNLNSELSETGRRTDLSVGTSFETRSNGEFSGRIGLTRDDNGNTNPLYEVSYSDSLRRGSYTVSLNQNITTGDLGQDALNSRIGLTYNQALTATTDLQSSLDYQTTDFLGSDTDTSRLNVSLGVSRELTEDWSVTSRYTYSVQNGDQQTADTDNRLFLGIETDLGWRP